MAITLFGSASTPTDNGTNTTDPTVVTPPLNMLAGDLVMLIASARNASATIAISQQGGQSWNSFATSNGTFATLSIKFMWCRFNGTWSANPSVSFASATCNIVAMVVFRPSSSSHVWAIDAGNTGGYSNQAAAASFTVSSATPQNPSNVSVAIACTDDDNTWTISGTNWVKTSLSTQYRNTSGSDASISWAYQIQTVAANTNSCVHTQATNGNDPGIWFRVTFYENKLPNPVNISQSVKRASYY